MQAFLPVPLLTPQPRPTPRPSRWNAILPRRLVDLRIGSVVVPRHLWDPHMRQKGVYRSVSYKVLHLSLHGNPIASTAHLPRAVLPSVTATLHPLSRLHPSFTREWPVNVPLSAARLLPYTADLLFSFLVTLAMSATFLTVGLLGPRVVSIYTIPSASMLPTLHVGDALLVEKISPRKIPPHQGEIVLFTPPLRLTRMLPPGTFLHRNDLFVKRVAAVAGDIVEVAHHQLVINGVDIDPAAPSAPDVAPTVIPDGFLFVVGDNPDRSLDSRFWGLLPVGNVIGRPVARIFPLDRIEIGV